MTDLASVMDASIAALGGSPAPSAAERSPLGRLRWDGERWQRQHDRQHRDAFGEPLASQPIGVGWWVVSIGQHHLADGHVLPGLPGRRGLCVDFEVSNEGEPTYICVETWRRTVHRLAIPADDVFEASRTTAGHVRSHLADVHAALGSGRQLTGWRLACPRPWVLGILPELLRLASA